MLYPLHLLVLPWMPPEASIVVLRFLHSLLGSLFTYVLLRTLGVGAVGGVLAGLVYAYSGFAAGQIVHSNVFHAMVWLPLALAFTERASRRGGSSRWRYALLAGATMGIQALAAHVHITLLSALAVAAFVGYRAILPLPRHPATDGAATISPPPPPSPVEGEGESRCPSPLAGWSTCITRWAAHGAAAMGVLGLVGAIGMGLAAVQLLPLYELAGQSFRSEGLAPGAAAVNSVWPGGLLTLLLPRLFDTPAGGFWGPWVKWETLVYVGILPLGLAGMGALTRSGPHRPYFAGLALVSLLLAFGPYCPLPLWDSLHSLPGFESLQSPGRFSLLFTLAIAVLAGYGAHWLVTRHGRPLSPLPHPLSPRSMVGPAIGAGLVLVGSAAVLTLGPLLDHLSREVENLTPGLQPFIEDYLRLAGVPPAVDGVPLGRELLGRLLAGALSPANPATWWQIALLLCSAAAVGLGLLAGALRPAGAPARRATAGALVGIVAADLAVLGLTFHPYGRIADLAPRVPPVLQPASGGPGLFRVYTPPTTEEKRTQVEPNRLLPLGIEEAGGYSSLEPDRHVAFGTVVRYSDNHLLDLWNVRYLVQRQRAELFPSYSGTVFHPQRPLLSGKPLTPGAGGTLLPEAGTALVSGVQIVSSLWDSAGLEDGFVVARIVLEGPDGMKRTLDLRAGRDVSDAALDVPGSTVPVRHGRAEVAFQYQRMDPRGDRFGEQLYLARFPMDTPMRVSRVTIERTQGIAGLETYGVGLVHPSTGEVTQARQKAKYRLAYEDERIRIFENTNAMPRAFLVGHGAVAPPGRDVLAWMLDGPFDPARMAILECDPGTARSPSPLPFSPGKAEASCGRLHELVPTTSSGGRGVGPIPNPQPLSPDVPGSATIVSYRDQEVTVRTSAEAPTVLVLTDAHFPGWSARVDGVPAEIFRADYLFRGVLVPAGEHVVTFAYAPVPVALGAIITLLAACVVAAGAPLGSLIPIRTSAWGRPSLVLGRLRRPSAGPQGSGVRRQGTALDPRPPTSDLR